MADEPLTTPPASPAAAPENTPPAVPAAPENAAAPPAAVVVVQGARSEREIELEAELAALRDGKTKAEKDAAYALDKARRLEEQLKATPPASAPRKVPRDRWTLLHDLED